VAQIPVSIPIPSPKTLDCATSKRQQRVRVRVRDPFYGQVSDCKPFCCPGKMITMLAMSVHILFDPFECVEDKKPTSIFE